MAKLTIGKAIGQYLADLEEIKKATKSDIGRAIYVGAEVVANAIQQSIWEIPSDIIKDDQLIGLSDGLGIAKMVNDDGVYNVKIGFDGYNTHETPSWDNGQPNAMIARAIEKGTYFHRPYKFIEKAVRGSKKVAEQRMMQKIDQCIEMHIEQ